MRARGSASNLVKRKGLIKAMKAAIYEDRFGQGRHSLNPPLLHPMCVLFRVQITKSLELCFLARGLSFVFSLFLRKGEEYDIFFRRVLVFTACGGFSVERELLDLKVGFFQPQKYIYFFVIDLHITRRVNHLVAVLVPSLHHHTPAHPTLLHPVACEINAQG